MEKKDVTEWSEMEEEEWELLSGRGPTFRERMGGERLFTFSEEEAKKEDAKRAEKDKERMG